jgi:hypothetical protein
LQKLLGISTVTDMQTSPPPPAARAQRDHEGPPGAGRPGLERPASESDCPGAGPAGIGSAWPDECADELGWLGDAIDDRVAELFPELLAEQEVARSPHWPSAALAVLGLGVALGMALAASVLLRGSLLAACAVWPSTAVVCLAAARLARAPRS